LVSPAEAVINHISVHPDYRYRHVANEMLDELIQTTSVKIISAETDMDAVNFYKRYGFSIISLGEKYPGVHFALPTRLGRVPALYS
jgi:ribosomal protein S18 acetylase RimI-like enzyme